jgi:hypothetical protein
MRGRPVDPVTCPVAFHIGTTLAHSSSFTLTSRESLAGRWSLSICGPKHCALSDGSLADACSADERTKRWIEVKRVTRE